MIDTLRSSLYFLGFFANILFAGRFFVQWIQSEKRRESFVSRGFWRLSFLAHFTMCLHGYIQLQYPICLIQGLNACIAWRNLNLMGKKACSFSRTLWLLLFTTLSLTLLFFFQGSQEWMRAPTLPWSGSAAARASLLWHLTGSFGMFLFASRYWVQWWLAEKHQQSFLGRAFWWISCIGALFSLSYAFRLNDPVNILGFSVGLIPYIRNLMLIQKKAREAPQPSTRSVFLFAGEQSGDVLGSSLVAALKKRNPHFKVYGVGGPLMQQAGMEIFHPLERFQVMGFSAVIKALPRLLIDFRKIRNEILKARPAAVVLIDYPDFNMFLAKSLRKKGFQGKVIHYVCPSIWAWRKKRIHTLVKTLDHLLAILPFEKNLFAKTSLPVTFVGHPLIAAIDNYPYDPHWNPSQKPLIAIFPGSRRHEIELNLPLQLAAAKKLGPGYTLAVSVARPGLEELIRQHTDSSMLLVPSEKRYELMRAAQGAIATSGTIILELGLHGTPTLVTYQLASLNYLLGRYVFRIRLPFYTLVNIICGKEVYPEFIHKKLSSDEIHLALKRLLENPTACRQECFHLRELLTTRDASNQAAETVLECIVDTHETMPLP